MNSIEILHDQYQEYIDHQDTIETQTIESFARSLIEDSSSSVKGMLVRIQKVLNGPSSNDLRALGNVGLLQLIAQDMKVGKSVFLFNIIIYQYNTNTEVYWHKRSGSQNPTQKYYAESLSVYERIKIELTQMENISMNANVKRKRKQNK